MGRSKLTTTEPYKVATLWLYQAGHTKLATVTLHDWVMQRWPEFGHTKLDTFGLYQVGHDGQTNLVTTELCEANYYWFIQRWPEFG